MKENITKADKSKLATYIQKHEKMPDGFKRIAHIYPGNDRKSTDNKKQISKAIAAGKLKFYKYEKRIEDPATGKLIRVEYSVPYVHEKTAKAYIEERDARIARTRDARESHKLTQRSITESQPELPLPIEFDIKDLALDSDFGAFVHPKPPLQGAHNQSHELRQMLAAIHKSNELQEQMLGELTKIMTLILNIDNYGIRVRVPDLS